MVSLNLQGVGVGTINIFNCYCESRLLILSGLTFSITPTQHLHSRRCQDFDFELHCSVGSEGIPQRPPPTPALPIMEISESDTSGDMEISYVNIRTETSGGGGGGHAGEVGGGPDVKKRNRKDARDRSSNKKTKRPGRSLDRNSKKRKRSTRSFSRCRDGRGHPGKRNWTSTRRSESPVRRTLSFSPIRTRSRSPPRRHHRRQRSRSRTRSPRRSWSRSLSDGNGCRDFDERGLCLLGELCPYDHGTDALVLRETMSPADNRVARISIDYTRGMPDDYVSPSMRPNPSHFPTLMGEYNPDSPAIDSLASGGWWNQMFTPQRIGNYCGGRGGGMMGHPQQSFHPRELRSVPLMGMPEMQPEWSHPQGPSNMGMMSPLSTRGMFSGRGLGRRRRGGFDRRRLGLNQSIQSCTNCAVEVRRIPRHQNNINDLYTYFRKFGKITKIQIHFEGHVESALVMFSSQQEAAAAVDSTQPVMNNPCITVTWMGRDKEKETGGVERRPLRFLIRNEPVEGESGEQQQQEQNMNSNNSPVSKPAVNPALLPLQSPSKNTETPLDNSQAAAETRKKLQAQTDLEESLMKAQEEKNAGIITLANGLRKRKQKLIVQQLEVQKRLISKLESDEGATLSEEKRSEMLSLIKSLDINIGAVRNVLVEDNARRQSMLANAMNAIAPPEPPPAPPVTIRTKKHSKEDVQKEILDAELDLYNREQCGGDTSDLQNKISELRAQAVGVGGGVSGGGTFWGPHRGGRGGRGRRGRGARMVYRGCRDVGNIDRRSAEIIVFGFPPGRLPEILPHFSHFGVIAEYSFNPLAHTMTITYDSRKSAESAMNNGSLFGDSWLNIKWSSGM